MKINVDNLIKAASRQLGMPEDKLRAAVKSGNTAEIKKYMSGEEAQKLDSALKDRRYTEEIKNRYGS